MDGGRLGAASWDPGCQDRGFDFEVSGGEIDCQCCLCFCENDGDGDNCMYVCISYGLYGFPIDLYMPSELINV